MHETHHDSTFKIRAKTHKQKKPGSRRQKVRKKEKKMHETHHDSTFKIRAKTHKQKKPGSRRQKVRKKKKKSLRPSALIAKATGHLGVQDTKLMQSLHHFLVINVPGVVSIVPPAHQSH